MGVVKRKHPILDTVRIVFHYTMTVGGVWLFVAGAYVLTAYCNGVSQLPVSSLFALLQFSIIFGVILLVIFRVAFPSQVLTDEMTVYASARAGSSPDKAI